MLEFGKQEIVVHLMPVSSYAPAMRRIIGALGAGKNRMYVIPSLNAVIARQTLLENDTFADTEFLATLLVE